MNASCTDGPSNGVGAANAGATASPLRRCIPETWSAWPETSGRSSVASARYYRPFCGFRWEGRFRVDDAFSLGQEGFSAGDQSDVSDLID
jgi:hypothetical protein